MFLCRIKQRFNSSVIPPGTSLRTFAYLFLKLSRRTFIKISLIIKECPEEILIKLTIVLKAETRKKRIGFDCPGFPGLAVIMKTVHSMFLVGFLLIDL
jgi:hypothetical protein